MAFADVTGYMMIAAVTGGAVSYLLPKVKEIMFNESAKSLERVNHAREFLKQYKPDQVAVIKNYLNHGGYHAGVSAVVGDMQFIDLAGDIGHTLRQRPDLLDDAMRYTPPAPPGEEIAT